MSFGTCQSLNPNPCSYQGPTVWRAFFLGCNMVWHCSQLLWASTLLHICRVTCHDHTSRKSKMNLVFLKVSLESSSVIKKGLLLLRRTVFEGNTIKSLTVFTLLYVCILLLCIFGLLFPLLRDIAGRPVPWTETVVPSLASDWVTVGPNRTLQW